MPRRSLLITVLSAALCMGAPTPGAHAGPPGDVTYDVTYIGLGTYHQDRERVLDADTMQRSTTDLMVSWSAVYEGVRFREGELVEPVRDLIPKASTEGTHTEVHRGAGASFTTSCDHLDDDVGEGTLGHGLAMAEGETELVLRPAERLVSTLRCPDPLDPGSFWHPAFDLQSPGATSDPAILGAAPLDAVLDVPHEALGMGRIVERVARNASVPCPAQDLDGSTTTCRLDWTGEVEWVRKDHVRERPAVGLSFDERTRRLALTVRCVRDCHGLLNVRLHPSGRHLVQVRYRAKGGVPTRIARRLSRLPRGTTRAGLRVRSVPL